MNIRSYARISGEIAGELDITTQNTNGDYIVRLEIAQQLYPEEYAIIDVEDEFTEQDLLEMPIVVGNPIVRPRKTKP